MSLRKNQQRASLLAVSLQDELLCKDEKWEELLIASGLWIGICEKILPQQFFTEKIMNELKDDFKKNGRFRDELFEVSGREPPSECRNLEVLGSWLVNQVPTLRRTNAHCEADAKEGGLKHPSFVLGKLEADEYNGANYWT